HATTAVTNAIANSSQPGGSTDAAGCSGRGPCSDAADAAARSMRTSQQTISAHIPQITNQSRAIDGQTPTAKARAAGAPSQRERARRSRTGDASSDPRTGDAEARSIRATANGTR